jgi:murein DD-endopeptidase MepM/ murein hydrolase activator NlpD
MNMIFYSRRAGGARHVELLKPLPVIAVGLLLTAVFGLGLLAGRGTGAGSGLPDLAVAKLEEELSAQREELAGIEREASKNLDAMAVRMGQLNAHIIRLDALGRRLVTMADLEEGEFDFSEAPPQGGPDTDLPGPSAESRELSAMLDELALKIDDRAAQLDVLERVLSRREISAEQNPEGRPIRSGWLSSYYGKRADPFTGKPKFHHGVDFAGTAGSEVLAVAAGVVTYSGDRYSYGNMVEVNHGNGLITRYGHAEETLVEIGQTVEKGQPIALMGSTGRSTGPHVHFEVLKNGRKVNPLKYVQP